MCDFCKPNYGYNYGSDYLYYEPALIKSRTDEPNPDNELPQVGQAIYDHQAERLPVGAVLKSDSGGLYVRGAKYNTDGRKSFLIPLEEDKPSRFLSKYTIEYIPEWPTEFQVGDVVSHAQAQLLPRFTVLMYERDAWSKEAFSFPNDSTSHWYVTDRKVSNRCGVVKPMNGQNHWSSFYKIVYLPKSAK